MAAATPYLDAVSSSLPIELSDILISFDIFARDSLETLVRFCLDGACPERITVHPDKWAAAKVKLHERLSRIEPNHRDRAGGAKRAREADEAGGADGAKGTAPSADGTSSKKQKLKDEAEDSPPLYTLYALSVSAPVRKKVDIAITQKAMRFTNPATHALEARVPLTALSRAFMVSYAGKNKNKAQWAITILSSDTVSKKEDASSQVQVAFNVDQNVASAKEGFRTASGDAMPEMHAKGAETLPFLMAFLKRLPSHIELHNAPDPALSVQPFASTAGQPYVDAYRGAKEGALCFLPRGILWSGARPCEFFALEDLAPDSDVPNLGGVKTLSATGRTLSVFVRRSIKKTSAVEEDEEEAEESEFAMIDGRELGNVNSWIRKYRRSFGLPREGLSSSISNNVAKGKVGAEAKLQEAPNHDDSDESDDDFRASSDSDGGEPTSDSEISEGAGEREEEEEEEKDHSTEENEVEEVDPPYHPLMQPMAVPRMSKAAMDAAVKMVVGDMELSAEEEEEDELE